MTALTFAPLAQRKVSEFAAQSRALSRPARLAFTVFSHLTFDELVGTQKVYLDDHKRREEKGDAAGAEVSLNQAEALGEVIDMMVGDTRDQ